MVPIIFVSQRSMHEQLMNTKTFKQLKVQYKLQILK